MPENTDRLTEWRGKNRQNRRDKRRKLSKTRGMTEGSDGVINSENRMDD